MHTYSNIPFKEFRGLPEDTIKRNNDPNND